MGHPPNMATYGHYLLSLSKKKPGFQPVDLQHPRPTPASAGLSFSSSDGVGRRRVARKRHLGGDFSRNKTLRSGGRSPEVGSPDLNQLEDQESQLLSRVTVRVCRTTSGNPRKYSPLVPANPNQ